MTADDPNQSQDSATAVAGTPAPESGKDERPQPASGTDDEPGRLQALEIEAADLKDRLLRVAAEMENLRRRNERELADTRQYAVTGFARDMVSVADNLRRALESVPAGAGEADPSLARLVEGVEMTERELLKALGRHGIQRLDPQGQKFDPNFHQAMFEVENADVAGGTVVQVVQPGYSIGDRVLRPALVGVSKTPKPGQQSNVSQDNAPAPDSGSSTPSGPGGERPAEPTGPGIDRTV